MFYFISYIKGYLATIYKILALLIVLIVVSVVFIKFISPKGEEKLSTNNQNHDRIRDEIWSNVDNPLYQKSREGKIYIGMYRLASCKVLGEACTDNPRDGDINISQSYVGYITQALSFVYLNPPASGIAWVRYSLGNSGFIPKSYAAEGIGAAAIKPLSTMWSVLRNVTFLLLTLLLVIIGFLVMFRFKINPQTIVTAENALPRIIITLLFITFSFAIAGFLIDLMYVAIIIGVSVFSQADPQSFGANLNTKFLTPGIGAIWDFIFPPREGFFENIPILGDMSLMADLGSSLFSVLPTWLRGLVRVILSIPFAFYLIDKSLFSPGLLGIINKVAGMFGNIDAFTFSLGDAPVKVTELIANAIALPLLAVIGWLIVPGILLGIACFITILFLFFRIFFMFITSYLKILMYVIFSPILILPGVIPGQKAFSKWLRGLAGELSIFVVTIYLMCAGRVFVSIFERDETTNLWRPPFLYSISGKSIALLIGMGLIFLIPQIAKMTREKISGSKGSGLNIGAGLFLGGIGGGVGGAAGALTQFGSLKFGLGQLASTRFGEAIFKGKFKPPEGSGGHPPHS